MTIATGIAKQVRSKKEVTWSVPPGATAAQLMRRVTSDLALGKQTYQSAEIRSDYQVADFRHGVKSVAGTISGEISPGTYQEYFAAALRAQWGGTVATTGALTNVTATVTAPQFVRAAGSYITDGFKVGDVIRWSGWTAGAAPNNAKNFLITGLTALQMTGIFLDGSAVVAVASGDSVTGLLKGKKVFTPSTGHTDDSFAIEHWHSDVAQSELFLGCKVTEINIGLPPTGMSTIGIGFMGKDMQPGVVEYFTTPTAETTTGVIASVNGAIYVGNTKIALLTGLTMKINGNMSAEPVVGSNTYPDIFEGRVLVDGQMTAFFEDGTLRDYFVNETEVGIYAAFTTGNLPTDDFVVFNMPRVKAGGAGKDDGEKGLVQTIPFQVLLNKNGGAGTNSDRSTLIVQDSTIV